MTVITDKKAYAKATPILATDAARLPKLLQKLTPAQRRWVAAGDFEGRAHTHCAVPGSNGEVALVLTGVRDGDDPWALAHLPLKLAPGRYALAKGPVALGEDKAAFGWALGSYQYTRYKRPRRKPADLQLGASAKVMQALGLAEAVKLVRDLVNTPAEDMGPAELSDIVREQADHFGAEFDEWVG
jgi:leucyl aminopeptidase